MAEDVLFLLGILAGSWVWVVVIYRDLRRAGHARREGRRWKAMGWGMGAAGVAVFGLLWMGNMIRVLAPSPQWGLLLALVGIALGVVWVIFEHRGRLGASAVGEAQRPEDVLSPTIRGFVKLLALACGVAALLFALLLIVGLLWR